MADILLGTDGNFVADSTGDVELVDGDKELLQDVIHNLMTYPGDLWTDSTYGTPLFDYLQLEQLPLNQEALLQAVRLGINSDERIDPSRTRVSILAWDDRSISTQATFQKATEQPDTESSFIVLVEIGNDGVVVR